MVELFAVAGFASDPRSKSPAVRPVARLETPHAGQVERGRRPRTPCAGLRIVDVIDVFIFEYLTCFGK